MSSYPTKRWYQLKKRPLLTAYRALLCVMIIMWVGRSGFCLLIYEYSLAQLWDKADLVIRGEVTGSVVYKEQGRLLTRYTFAPSKVYTHDSSQRIQDSTSSSQILFHLPGGHLDGLSQRVVGMPVLVESTDYIIFLRCSHPKHCVPLGYGQGIWRSIDESKTKWTPLSHETLDAHLLSPLRQSSEIYTQSAISLEALLEGHETVKDGFQPRWQPNVTQP